MRGIEFVRPLLLLELRRQRSMLLRLAVVSLAACAMFFFIGKRTAYDQLAIVLGTSFGGFMLVPLGIARDKMEGTLEFLAGLPVEPATIVASRYGAMALFTLPWASAVGLLSVAVPAGYSINPVAVAAIAWLVLTLFGAIAIAVTSKFDLQSLVGGPVIVVLMLATFGPRIVRRFFPQLTPRSFLEFGRQPFAPAIVALALLFAIALTVWVAWATAVRSIANYRRDATAL